jgi:hypothetical protein
MKTISKIYKLKHEEICEAIREYIASKTGDDMSAPDMMVEINMELTPATRSYSARVGKDIYE